MKNRIEVLQSCKVRARNERWKIEAEKKQVAKKKYRRLKEDVRDGGLIAQREERREKHKQVHDEVHEYNVIMVQGVSKRVTGHLQSRA